MPPWHGQSALLLSLKKVFLFSVKTEKRKKSVLSHEVEAFARNAERVFQDKPNSADDVDTLQWCGRELLCTKVLAAAEAWVARAQTTDLQWSNDVKQK